MKSNHITYFLFTLFLLSTYNGFTQTLSVTDATENGFDPETLITDYFLGPGIEVVDIAFEGNPESIGYFNGDDSLALGISSGILITSGTAATQNIYNIGANGNSDDLADVHNGSEVNDNDVNTIAAGSSVNNISRYTITFIPQEETLRFRYVFASEEYPEYICSEYNDLFGFFISGPGIEGGYENDGINLAVIPGTDVPITINNINTGEVGANGILPNCTPPYGSLEYSHFYNSTPFGQPPVYDGFTDVFLAKTTVQPGETYTLKMIIGDISDTQLDSGVFLEAGSFSAGVDELDCSHFEVQIVGTDTICSGSTNDFLSTEFENGVPPFQYSWSNGDTANVLTQIEAGDYSLTVEDATGCLVTDEIAVQSANPLNVHGDALFVTCEGGSDGSIDLTVTSGNPPYSFLWSNGDTSEDLMNVESGEYIVSVTDAIGCFATFSAMVSEVPGIEITLSFVNVMEGNDGSAGVSHIVGGTPPYTIEWSTGETTEVITNLAPGTYEVTVTDVFGCTAMRAIEIGESTDTNQIEEAKNWRIYPTPGRNIFYLERNEVKNEQMLIEIFDVSGKLLKSFKINSMDSVIPLDIKQLSSGLYWLSVENEEGRKVEKLVIK